MVFLVDTNKKKLIQKSITRRITQIFYYPIIQYRSLGKLLNEVFYNYLIPQKTVYWQGLITYYHQTSFGWFSYPWVPIKTRHDM